MTGYGAGMSVPDWPTTYGYWFYPLHLWIRVWDLFLEHGHRMLAQLVGIVTIVPGGRWCGGSTRARAVRWLALAAVIGVIFQGTFGGLRVDRRRRLLARVHGCTAPLFFTLCAALVSVTSRRWLTAAGRRRVAAAGRLHRLLWAIAAAIYIEIMLGTQLRPLRSPSAAIGFDLLVWAKVIVAASIAAVLAWLWFKAEKTEKVTGTFCRHGPLGASRKRCPSPFRLVRRVRLLVLFFAIQIILACATWVTHYGWPAWFTACFGAVPYTVVETAAGRSCSQRCTSAPARCAWPPGRDSPVMVVSPGAEIRRRERATGRWCARGSWPWCCWP